MRSKISLFSAVAHSLDHPPQFRNPYRRYKIFHIVAVMGAVNDAKHLPFQINQNPRRFLASVNIRGDQLIIRIRHIYAHIIGGHHSIADRIPVSQRTAESNHWIADDRTIAGTGCQIRSLHQFRSSFCHFLQLNGNNRQFCIHVSFLYLRFPLCSIAKCYHDAFRINYLLIIHKNQYFLRQFCHNHSRSLPLTFIRIVKPVHIRHGTCHCNYRLPCLRSNPGQRSVHLGIVFHI